MFLAANAMPNPKAPVLPSTRTPYATSSSGLSPNLPKQTLQPPPPLRCRGRCQRNRAFPAAGFRAVASLTTAAADDGRSSDDDEDILKDLNSLAGAEDVGEAPEVLSAFVRLRYGNKANKVLAILRLREAYGVLYAAWRDASGATTHLPTELHELSLLHVLPATSAAP
eukprot:6178465-Pleurochrysis_carterae.AAC.3